MGFDTVLKSLRLAPLVVAALTLSGCLSSSALDELNDATPQGSQFTQELFKNYSYLAHSFGEDVTVDTGSSLESDDDSFSLFDGDSSDDDLASIYARKALDAAKGIEVAPEPAPDANAQGIRSRLMRALDAGRDRFPTDAARAQVDYDCMIINARSKAMLTAAAQCGRSLQGSLGQLEKDLRPAPPPVAAPPPASDYTVYFDFDSWSLTGEDLTVLQNAVNTARAGGQSRIAIVGHTDTSGNPGYNQHLSEHRANVVKEALIDMGARREAIQTSGVGEGDLAVATGDGVKEPKNRRAVVTLLP